MSINYSTAQKAKNWLSHFACAYLSALPRIAYQMTASVFFNRREALHFLHQVLAAQDLDIDDPILGSVDITEFISLTPESIDVVVQGPYYDRLKGGTASLLELSILGFLIRQSKAKRIFEIGTFVGRTTRHFALNSTEDCQIYTLDLPTSPLLQGRSKGEDFVGTREQRKITQLTGDSSEFDFSVYYGTCDFVWVDGCHEYSMVVSDSRQALKLCKPGGYVAWHDYRHTQWWSGVTRAVRELAAEVLYIRHLRGTTIAIAKVG